MHVHKEDEETSAMMPKKDEGVNAENLPIRLCLRQKRFNYAMSIIDPTKPSTSKIPDDYIYSEPWYYKQRLASANVVHLLKDREIGGRKPRIPKYALNRIIQTAIPLSRGAVCPEMISRDHIVTWTPDGERLITYSSHLDMIRAYRYLGVQNSRNIVEDSKVPASFLKLDFEIKPHVADGFQLRLDAIYFTASANFFVVGASSTVAEANVHLENIFLNNESMPISQSNLEDLVLFCIDTEQKKIVSEKNFCMDRIPLANGINISGNYMLVTSIQHQTIMIIQIHPQTGEFFTLKEIGPSVRDDDTLHLPAHENMHLRTTFYTGFKQRIMTFLFKRAKKNNRVMEFLRSTEYYHNLRIDKAYLFEEFFILIRMLPKDTSRENTANPCFFVVMDWREVEIRDIFDEFDERFLDWAVSCCEPLNYPVTTGAWVGAFNFPYHAQWNMVKGIRRGEMKHCSESLRRLLNQMPFASYQPFKISTQSPYMDQMLFQLDVKTATGIINGKLRTDQDDPRFIVTRTKKASFQLAFSVIQSIGLRQLTLLFHPQDPIAVAFDRLRQDPTLLVFQISFQGDDPPSNHPRRPVAFGY